MSEKSKVLVFIDDVVQPVAEFEVPIQFQLDTRRLVDGKHTMKIIGTDHQENLLIVSLKLQVLLEIQFQVYSFG